MDVNKPCEGTDDKILKLVSESESVCFNCSFSKTIGLYLLKLGVVCEHCNFRTSLCDKWMDNLLLHTAFSFDA